MLGLLGTMPDQSVADELGVSYDVVYYRRRKLGIPAFCRTRGISWTSKMDTILGTMPDEDAGLTKVKGALDE